MQSAEPFGFPKHAYNYRHIPNPLRGQNHHALHRMHSHRGLGKWRQRCGGGCRSSEEVKFMGKKMPPTVWRRGLPNVFTTE